jgi:hypothetical protein
VALGNLKDPGAVGPLIAAFKDTEVGLRARLTEALAEIGPPAIEPLIAALRLNDPGVQSGAVDALARLGAAAAERLIAVSGDSDPSVRKGVADALAEIGRPAVGPLLAALGDADWRIRSEAATALRRIGDPRAAEIARTKARDLAPLAETYPEWIMKAEPGTENKLIDALNVLGSVDMARAFLKCGNLELEEAGRRWLENHGKEIPFNSPKTEKGPLWGGQAKAG